MIRIENIVGGQLVKPQKICHILLLFTLMGMLSSCKSSEKIDEKTSVTCTFPQNGSTAENNSENIDVDDEILVGEFNRIENYYEKDYIIDSETAISNVIDSLTQIDMLPQKSKLMCEGVVLSNNVSYYQVRIYSENQNSISNLGDFWVNAYTGVVYFKFDPTLDSLGIFSRLAGEYDQNDGRTRLIKLKLYLNEHEKISDIYENNNESQFNAAVEEKKNELNRTDSPFGVCDIYSGTRFDYNKDGSNDYVIAYELYAQFEFVIFDGKTCEILADERIMMYLEPECLVTEIYTDNNGNFVELFSSKIQVVSAGELTETVQIIKINDTKMFEAVYDHDTGEFLHAYDKYSTYDEYISAQEKYLNGSKHFMDISWCEYKLDCN